MTERRVEIPFDTIWPDIEAYIQQICVPGAMARLIMAQVKQDTGQFHLRALYDWLADKNLITLEERLRDAEQRGDAQVQARLAQGRFGWERRRGPHARRR